MKPELNKGVLIVSVKGLILAAVLILGACASNRQSDSNVEPVKLDKYESINRKVFAFNDGLDRWLLKPVAKGYLAVAPRPVETGVSNFFSNLGEISNVINDVLQWKWSQAGNDSGRFLLNSTVGLLGLIDVAAKTGLEKSAGEDFGQTLAVWGLPRSSYIVLPFLGPSSLSDAPAIPVNWYTSPLAYINPDRDRYIVSAVDLVQIRAGLLEVEDMVSGDRYTFIRDAWLQRREYLINDGEVEDEFGDEFGDEFE